MAALDLLLGPMLLGLTLNSLLLGALLVQYYIYWTGSFRRDPLGIKILVTFLMLADVANLLFDLVFTWLYTISHFGDFTYIQKSNWVFNTDPVMTVIISSTVQAFFAWRVNKLTGQRWLYFLLNLSALIQFLCGLGATIGCSIVKEFANFQSFRSVVIIWLTLSAATDLVIAGVMVHYLRSRRTGIAQTEDIITKLVRFTIQTGLITSLCAVVDLIVYLSLANNLHLFLNMTLSKLYSGACLSSLNARTVWSVESTSSPAPGFSRAPVVGINITTTSAVHRDSIEMDDSPPSSYPHPHPNHNFRKTLSPRRTSRTMPVSLDVPSLAQAADIADSRLTVTTDQAYGASFNINPGFDGKGNDLFNEKDNTFSPNTAVASKVDDREQIFSIEKSRI